MRLGLLGGTFDPIHNGHLRMARSASARGLDFVAFVPACRPPHKSRPDITGPYHRFAMAALATADEAAIGVSAHEVAREGSSYTIDTVRHFVGAGNDVTLIMGSDSLAEIGTWRDCHELLDLAGVLVYPRLPIVGKDLERNLPDWARRYWDAGRIACLEGDPVEASSTEIRDRLRSGRPCGDLLPAAVEQFIIKHGIYAGATGEPEGRAD